MEYSDTGEHGPTSHVPPPILLPMVAQLPEDLPYPLSQTSEHRLLSVLWAEHNVIFAVPFHVRLAFPLSHVDLLF